MKKLMLIMLLAIATGANAQTTSVSITVTNGGTSGCCPPPGNITLFWTQITGSACTWASAPVMAPFPACDGPALTVSFGTYGIPACPAGSTCSFYGFVTSSWPGVPLLGVTPSCGPIPTSTGYYTGGPIGGCLNGYGYHWFPGVPTAKINMD